MAPRAAIDDYDHLYKVILVGDPSVGKTFLLSKYTKATLPAECRTTVGVEFATHTVPLASGGTVKAQIWDTAGQERYRAITSAHFRHAVGAFIVYDVTKKQSFVNASIWLQELKEHAHEDCVIMLVGNKADLAETNPHDRRVPFDQAAQFAAAHGLLFTEASAVTSYNVKSAFESLLQEVYAKQCLAAGAAPAPEQARKHYFTATDDDLRGLGAAFRLGDADDDEAQIKSSCWGFF